MNELGQGPRPEKAVAIESAESNETGGLAQNKWWRSMQEFFPGVFEKFAGEEQKISNRRRDLINLAKLHLRSDASAELAKKNTFQLQESAPEKKGVGNYQGYEINGNDLSGDDKWKSNWDGSNGPKEFDVQGHLPRTRIVKQRQVPRGWWSSEEGKDWWLTHPGMKPPTESVEVEKKEFQPVDEFGIRTELPSGEDVILGFALEVDHGPEIVAGPGGRSEITKATEPRYVIKLSRITPSAELPESPFADSSDFPSRKVVTERLGTGKIESGNQEFLRKTLKDWIEKTSQEFAEKEGIKGGHEARVKAKKDFLGFVRFLNKPIREIDFGYQKPESLSSEYQEVVALMREKQGIPEEIVDLFEIYHGKMAFDEDEYVDPEEVPFGSLPSHKELMLRANEIKEEMNSEGSGNSRFAYSMATETVYSELRVGDAEYELNPDGYASKTGPAFIGGDIIFARMIQDFLRLEKYTPESIQAVFSDIHREYSPLRGKVKLEVRVNVKNPIQLKLENLLAGNAS